VVEFNHITKLHLDLFLLHCKIMKTGARR